MTDQKNVSPLTHIIVKGAREHNLKNISLAIPKNQLVIITGPSGSGKSSLALDTLYAEGRRRYVESLSSYARQFLGVTRKPDIDKLEGLCPAVAIDQKTVGYNPRSTVGTITEMYDYLRVLYARIGIIKCPRCSNAVSPQSPQTVAALVQQVYNGQSVMISAPIVIDRKGEFAAQLISLFQKGYTRFRIDGATYKCASQADVEKIQLHKTRRHSIDVILDKCTVTVDNRVRVQEAAEKAFSIAMGYCRVTVFRSEDDPAEYLYTADRMCVTCGISFPELEPRLFSFNSPIGACKTCHGLGVVERWGANSLDDDEESSSYYRRAYSPCTACEGKRLCPEACSVFIDEKSIYDMSILPLSTVSAVMRSLDETLVAEKAEIAQPLVREISLRIQFLIDVGLGYLTLGRTARTLSGGEGQRIRLATQIGAALSGVLYVLDEPSIGLHQRDNDRLIATLKSLRDQGNSVVVVEHDMETMEQADWLIDMGPSAGILGGQVIAQGTPAEVAADENSLSGAYLSRRKYIPVPEKRRQPFGWLTVEGVSTNNLRNVTARFPLGVMTGVTGVSGSGKSSLVMHTLAPLLLRYFAQGVLAGYGIEKCEGVELLENCVLVNQAPIGRTPRSNPATYLGIFDEIRGVFAALPESKIRGYDVGQFSFNVAKGRCSTCSGDGKLTIQMHFLEDVEIECKSCRGKRYNSQTLEIRFNGKNIADILDLSVAEATVFFAHFSRISKRLQLMCDVGLGYIKLGQSATTLSGGEAQRVKLVNELAKRGNKTLYILDEPTTGLHTDDVAKLVTVLNRLVDQGNSVIVIEHNLDLLKCVDHVIDIGPEGGEGGGMIVAAGTPEEVSRVGASITGKYLARELAS